MRPGFARSGGPAPFTPLSLPTLELWLPTSAYSITSGTLHGADQSGNGNNAVQASTSTTIVAASSGNPAHLHFPGGGSSSLITGTWAVTIPVNTPVSYYQLRKIPTNSTNGRWFAFIQALGFGLDHDQFGSPGRTLGGNIAGSQFLTWNDNSTAWVVDVTIQDGAGNGQLLSGATSEATGVMGNQAAQPATTVYRIGGPCLSNSGDDARDLAELVLYGAAHNALTQAKVVNYLLGTIPP